MTVPLTQALGSPPSGTGSLQYTKVVLSMERPSERGETKVSAPAAVSDPVLHLQNGLAFTFAKPSFA